MGRGNRVRAASECSAFTLTILGQKTACPFKPAIKGMKGKRRPGLSMEKEGESLRGEKI